MYRGVNRQERAFGFELDDQPERGPKVRRTIRQGRNHIFDRPQTREILAAYADDGEQEVLAKVDASRVEVV